MGNHWKPGIVTEHAGTPRSYRIRTVEGGEYSRNIRVLMKSPESGPSATDISPYHESPSPWKQTKVQLLRKQPIRQFHLLKSPPQHLESKQKFIHLMRKSRSHTRPQVEELWESLYVYRIMLGDNEHISYVLKFDKTLWTFTWNCEEATMFHWICFVTVSTFSHMLKFEETLWTFTGSFVFEMWYSVTHFCISLHSSVFVFICPFSFVRGKCNDQRYFL